MSVGIQSFDVVIVGAGGSGLRTALELSHSGLKTAVISKVFPTRSHTVSAQGGITAALGNVDEDHWLWHMFDTVKGSDYLGDQDSIEYMCQMGPQIVYELEHMGLPFSRLENGKIFQRPFGGQSKNFGQGGQATRTSAAADRTGHALLHTLYQQNLQAKTEFYNEWFAIDLVKDVNGSISGVLAICIETGEPMFFKSKVVVFASGGGGRIYQNTSNALINTGDGLGMILRAGLPLQDMEMWQFHPTGIAGVGILVTEGARGEGGYLLNNKNERFMERYAPHAKDLASRDVVTRSIALEIREGRGCGPKQEYVLLKLDHMGKDIIQGHLPGIRDLAMTFANVDPIKDPIPVMPTCHYMMGGIPTNIHGQVTQVDEKGNLESIPGLYAVGECACVSVHGANRLGGNSLLDLVVFGRSAGIHIKESFDEGRFSGHAVSNSDVELAFTRLKRWDSKRHGEKVSEVRSELQKVMQDDFGVFRTEKTMQEGLKKLQIVEEKLKHAAITDFSKVFNTARVEALELDNLMAIALATAYSAINRTETRGAHAREDYPKRNDEEWLKHTLYYPNHTIRYRSVNLKPLTVDSFPPKARTY